MCLVNKINDRSCLVGSIIRCMRRLEETLREMCQAAKTIGNTQLENKFSEGQRHISDLSWSGFVVSNLSCYCAMYDDAGR